MPKAEPMRLRLERLQLENRDLRERMGECERLRHAAIEASADLCDTLEAIGKIAEVRSASENANMFEPWRLVRDLTERALRHASRT